MPIPMDELSLLQLTNELLTELRLLRGQMDQLNLQQAEVLELLRGFTAGGASFHAYQVDPFTSAYIALIANAMSDRLAKATDQMPITELVKAAIPLSRSLLEELDAYRSSRGGLDYLEDQAGFLCDPSTETP